jgi:NSS family neurotransmitter:Na+ symporter
MIFQALAVAMAGGVLFFGVKGIERVAKVLMPTLVILVVILMIRAVTLPGAGRGLAFLFTPQWGELANYRIWLEALAQNAWDTGAGWGLVLCYAVYSRANEDTNLNSVMLACGNNLISLIAGIMVLCTVFAMRPNAASEIVGAGNEGLTFVWVPRLFDEVPGGSFFLVLFFLALVFAAWTSFVATYEVGVRTLRELGFSRKPVVIVYGIVLFIAGVPSSLSEPVFRNQDWVWSVALMVSGLFYALAVHKYGVRRFRTELINTEFQSFKIGRWWEWSMHLIVVLAVVMIIWWLWQMRAVPLFAREGVGNTLAQWGVTIAIVIGLNGWIMRRMRRVDDTTGVVEDM